jgi:hypothetical protein
MFKTLQHLLPNGRAWRATAVNKQLTRLITGLSAWGGDARSALDTDYDELQPAATGALDEWENQFGLPPSLTPDSDRRARLDAAWKAVGGQSPRYLQDTLRSAGFDVYVHEWWAPGAEPPIGSHACAVPRNPLLYLRLDNLPNYQVVDCGEPFAEGGEPFAECGNSINPIGYPLVNKIEYSSPDQIVLCGEPFAECGEADAACGNFFDYEKLLRRYTVPTDPTKWPYFWYVGGAVFGQQASVPVSRRDEFEALCLKIGPLHQWIGVMVNYN